MGKAKSDKQCFWRDAGLPFVELRRVDDGRGVCYERHSHDTFSIGIVKGGRSTYWNRGKVHETGKGSVVVLNPEDVHGCNPVPGGGWCYDMLFVDPAWLLDLQVEIDADAAGRFAMFSDTISHSPMLYSGLQSLAGVIGVSRSYLVRAFKKAHGMTPYAYLINCRVQKARHALKLGERIVDVALDCGFADQAHFQRVFKRLMATTPRHYAMAHVA